MAARRTYGTGSLIESTDKAGRVSYYGKWWRDGRQIKRRLGPKRTRGAADGLTKAQAEARMRDLIAEIAAEDVRRSKAGNAHRRTLAELGEAYLAARDLKTSTAQDYAMHLRAHLVPYFGGRPLERIDADSVAGLIDVLLARGLKVKTVRSYVTTLSTLLNYAVRKGWLRASPMPMVDLPPLGRDGDIEPLRFLRVFELFDLAAHATPGPYQELDRALYLTAGLSGLRQGELRGLTWLSVDLVAERIRVVDNIVRGEQTSPKSRKARSVPLAPQVQAELEALHHGSRWTADHHPVFADPITGQPIARTPLMERYRKALTAAGLDPAFRFHDLRHTFGTSLAAAGVPVTTIQAYMGHSDLKTTERYMHYAPAADEAARIGRAFELGDPRSTNPSTNAQSPEASQGIQEHPSAP